MTRLFGTDGIRGIANQEPVTPEMGIRIARAVVRHCQDHRTRPRILVGRDTRISGKMLEYAVASGILSVGAEAVLVGVISAGMTIADSCNWL